MSETIVFADVEGLAKSWAVPLLQAIDGFSDVQGFVKPPTTLPARFFTVRRAGGTSDSFVTEQPRLLVVCWGGGDNDDEDSSAICRQLRGLFLYQMPRSVIAGLPVYRVSDVGGPTPTIDPDTGRSRYMFTIQPRLRGAAQ